MTVPAFTVILDPAAAIGGRTELSLNTNPITVVNPSGIDWGEAAIKAWLAEQLYGETPSDYRIPNRQIQIPLALGSNPAGTEAEEEEARLKLQHKVALFQRQGGVLLRQRANGEPLYADIVNASLTIPDLYGEVGGVEPGVMLKLECLPDFYGAEVELGALTGTGNIVGLLKTVGGAQAVIAGDYPARARIVMEETSGKAQRAILFGLRSTRYDAAASAALFFDAKDMTPINGGVIAVGSGGTYSGKWLRIAAPEVEVWHPFLETTLSVGAVDLTHIGSYRVWARVQGAQVGQAVRLAWANADATAPNFNEAKSVSVASVFEFVDLGEIRLEEPPVGEHSWRGQIQVATGASSALFAVDRIWLQPLDDGAGKLRATAKPIGSLLGPSKTVPGANSASAVGGSVAGFSGTIEWQKPEGLREGVGTIALLGVLAKSKGLFPSAWGFAIPTGSTIQGIEVIVYGTLGQTNVQLAQASTLVGAAKGVAAFGGLVVLGGAADLWGATWTPAQVNAAGFGPTVFTENQSSETLTARVSKIVVRVYYSTAAGPTQDAIIYANRLSEIRTEGSYRQSASSSVYTGVSEETGDLLRIPPSGMEGRAVQLFLKNSRGNLEEPDPGIDTLRVANVFYRPCYLGRI